MFLGYVGLVRSEWLWAKWRYAVVLIAILAAVITPTADPITMTVFSVPLFVLYFLSIGLVKIVERRRPTEEPANSEGAEAEQEPLAYYQSLANPEDSGIPPDEAQDQEEAPADR
jgi:sec-independent protein translocase protein TatC